MSTERDAILELLAVEILTTRRTSTEQQKRSFEYQFRMGQLLTEAKSHMNLMEWFSW